jgi:hypothetical protein
MELSEEQLGLRYQVCCSIVLRAEISFSYGSIVFLRSKAQLRAVPGLVIFFFHISRGNVDVSMSDVAFLVSNHFREGRQGSKHSDNNVLYSELGGRSVT